VRSGRSGANRGMIPDLARLAARMDGGGNVSNDDPEVVAVGADAAMAATEKTADAIERAAERTDDPIVAEALDEAATHADTTMSRVRWLRGVIRRVFRRS
jgi:hypothetical protein